MKKILVTRKLLKSNEEKLKKLFDVKLNPNDYYVDSIPFTVDTIYIISLNLIFVIIGTIILFVTFSSITRFVPTININT